MKIAVISAALFLYASVYLQEKRNWEAPQHAKQTTNPLASDNTAATQGKQTYQKLCWTCHGQTGKGNGPTASGLNPKPVDFSADVFQQQTDGEIFWKISEGRGSMAAYKNSLSAKQRWQIVNYLRTLNLNP